MRVKGATGQRPDKELEIKESLKNYLRDLLWHERAQLRETMRVFTVFLFSVLIVVTLFGLLYYGILRVLGEPLSLVECCYFVWITFATIGYGDTGFTGTALIRVITILVGVFLTMRFIILAAHVYARVVVEEVYNLRVIKQMKKSLETAEGHFLIFGDDHELINKIIEGLVGNNEVFMVSEDTALLQEFKEQYKALKYLIAKPSSAETVDLLRPEVARCAYLLFREDEKNILLSAMLEKRVRVISSFSGNFTSVPRFKKVGVVPISPHFSGGLKIVSTMIRPQMTEFLDNFIFPQTSLLEFKTIPYEETESAWYYAILASKVDGEMVFGNTGAPGEEVVVIGFRDPSSASKKLGSFKSQELPLTTDRFLVIGGGTIGATVVSELHATKRGVLLIDSAVEEVERIRAQFSGEGVEYLVGDALSSNIDIDTFDGVAICTPVDEKNFTIGLDYIGHRIIRVVRAVDEDMEFHYKRIGAIPVFVGRVGSGRMLREVTNQFANEGLRGMLIQNFRLDQIYLSRPCVLADLTAEFGVQAIAVCRAGAFFFGPEASEELQAGDTLIFCGSVDANKKLRMKHLVAKSADGKS